PGAAVTVDALHGEPERLRAAQVGEIARRLERPAARRDRERPRLGAERLELVRRRVPHLEAAWAEPVLRADVGVQAGVFPERRGEDDDGRDATLRRGRGSNLRDVARAT